jgi:diguanylate cyclase (GGDEF)-like protein/PAS domain S-box-containing protein
LSEMSEAVFLTSREGAIEYLNAAAEALISTNPEQIIGQSIQEWLNVGDTQALEATVQSKPSEAQLRTSDGTTVFVSYLISRLRTSDNKEKLLFAAQNIDERKRAEQRNRYLARTDPLTKIANRMQFQHYLQQAIARARRANQHIAVMYLDVDRFKDINDTFGHAAGDTALELFSERLLEALPAGAIPGRLAGDEFAVLVTGFRSLDGIASELRAIASNLLATVGQPFSVNGEEIFMTTSLGVAVYPRDGDNVIDLIRNADAALYHAKKAGGNTYEFYSADMNVAALERLMIKSKLRRAFENDELRLHYQPKYGLKSGRIEGAEALIRWDQPDHGLLFPSDFIPLAEESNLIVQVGDWVLDKVCADYRRWQRTIPSPCRVSLNLSLRQLQQRRFLEKVKAAFKRYEISPTCLELEITETTLMEDTDRTVRILDSLYGMGLHLAIDDFGTGYSSLSALQQFPINTLKIDQSFVKDVAIDRDNAAIVRTIIQMGHSLGLDVVAEGVEHEDQLAFLRQEDCDYAQGHLFGDPMTGEEFCEVLAADNEGTGKYRALFG